MTQREMLNAVIANKVNDEVIDMAKAMLNKLDERNAKRASKPSKTAVANAPIKKMILEKLTTTPKTASVIASEVGITTQKASALLRQIEGLVVVDVKVPKKGTQKGYAIDHE